MLSDLTRHNRAVNAVRFSPNGQILASSDDGKYSLRGKHPKQILVKKK